MIELDPGDFPASGKSTYLNTASVALMYAGCRDAINKWNNNIADNGTVDFDEHAEQTVFENLHKSFARLLNSSPADIAVATSATEHLASMAWAIMPPKNSTILTTGIVFPTTVYPFARVARHTGARVEYVGGESAYLDPQKLYDRIDSGTSVVCLSHVEFGSGQKYDLRAFADRCHDVGALLVVDATQSAGAVPIDAPESGCDVLIAAGYKWLCGPFGAAAMYVAPHLQPTLEPGLIGFRSNKDIWNLEVDRQDYPDNAHRFESSTMAYSCALGLAEAVRFLCDTGIAAIEKTNLALADRLVGSLHELGAEVISPTKGEERTSIISARIPGTAVSYTHLTLPTTSRV